MAKTVLSLRSAFLAILLAFIIIDVCFAEAQGGPDIDERSLEKRWITRSRIKTRTIKTKKWTTKTKTTSKSTSTVTITTTTTATESCTPTAVQTKVGVYEHAQYPNGVPSPDTGLTFGEDWGYIVCDIFCSSKCPEEVLFCDPSCSTKGTCGNSMTTNFYLGGLVADLASPQNWIVPTPPAKSFTILRLFLTTADFYIDFYNSITVEISAVTKDGISLPPLAILLTKPAAGSGTFFAEKMVDLVALGFGDVSRLSFLPYFTGSVGTGGQGPDGRILAGLKIDGDGYGGPVRYEVYTPLGCSS